MFSRWFLLMTLAGCASPASAGTEAASALEAGQKEAVFAGGCFWCMEKPFDKIDGVVSTTSGYTGGKEEHPTYKEVSYHKTTHTEALRVVYDPAKVDYKQLLDVFWHNIDPTQASGQFCDKGEQYRTGVFTSDAAEKAAALESKVEVGKELKADVVTEISAASTFWVAEEYHQNYYVKNPEHYTRYRTGCGRDARLKQLWGDKAGH